MSSIDEKLRWESELEWRRGVVVQSLGNLVSGLNCINDISRDLSLANYRRSIASLAEAFDEYVTVAETLRELDKGVKTNGS